MDSYVKDGDESVYDKHIALLIKTLVKKNKFRYLFETQIQLCKVLKLKSNMGKRIRSAYNNKNFIELNNICNDIIILIRQVKKFHKVFSEQWIVDNKPHSLDVTDARLGALILRLESCHKRIKRYMLNNIYVIPELEEDNSFVDFDDDRKIIMQSWGELVTPNIL